MQSRRRVNSRLDSSTRAGSQEQHELGGDRASTRGGAAGASRVAGREAQQLTERHSDREAQSESERARKAREKRQFYQRQARSLQHTNALSTHADRHREGSGAAGETKHTERQREGSGGASEHRERQREGSGRRTRAELEAALEQKHAEIEGLMSTGQLEAAKELMREAQALAAQL